MDDKKEALVRLLEEFDTDSARSLIDVVLSLGDDMSLIYDSFGALAPFVARLCDEHYLTGGTGSLRLTLKGLRKKTELQEAVFHHNIKKDDLDSI